MFPVREIFLLLSNIAQTPKKENLIHDALSMMLAPDVAIMSKTSGHKLSALHCKYSTSGCGQVVKIRDIFNRPGVAGAVLHTAS